MIARVSTGWMAASFWALFVVLSLWLTLKAGLNLDSGAAMRLAQLRDLLSGQTWFDTAILPLLRPLLGTVAERVMLYAWPLLLFLPLLAALARIAAHLAGRPAAWMVLVLALLGVGIYPSFTPGGIDPRNLQLGLMLWALVFAMERRPIALPFVVALSLGVGVETLPYAIVFILLGCLWLLEDSERAFQFGVTLAGVAAILWFATTAIRYRVMPACDTYSEFYAALLVTTGAGVAVLGLLPRGRVIGFAVLFLAVVALGLVLNRGCFLGPGMDARPALDVMRDAPGEFFAGYVYAAFALAATLFLATSRSVLLVVLFAGLALLAASFDMRQMPFALVFALPGLAAAVASYVLPRGLIATCLALLVASDAGFAFAAALLLGKVAG